MTKKGIGAAGIILASVIGFGTSIGAGTVIASDQDVTVSGFQTGSAIETEDSYNIADPSVDKNSGSDSRTEKDNTNNNKKKEEVKNGWFKENGIYKYYKDGTTYTGCHYTGWHYMRSDENESKLRRSCSGTNGWFRTGLRKTGNNTQYVADITDGVIESDAADSKVLEKAVQFIESVTDDKMSREEKFLKCYQHVQISEFENPWFPHYTEDDWPARYADNYFDTLAGNCFSFASALAYIAKALDYENVYCCNGTIHGWLEIDALIYDTSKNYKGISYSQNAGYDYKDLISSGESWMRVKI